MTWFIDRRLNGKNKSMVNRQRFLRRYKAQIKQSISEAINKRSVTDVDSGESVSIPTEDIDVDSGESVSIPTEDICEPMFHQGRGGLRHRVHPGNDHFVQNDRIERPQGGGGGSGSGQGQASQDGEGQDEFVFQTISSRTTELNVLRVVAEVPAVVRARPARMVKVRMNLSFRFRKMSILICSLKIWPYPGWWRRFRQWSGPGQPGW